jgi:hypothetical protein
MFSQEDRTQVHSVKVKVNTKLREDGTNFSLWKDDLLMACLEKGKDCCASLEQKMEGTRANAAAKSLIRSSVTEWMASQTRQFATAQEMLSFIESQYRGGKGKPAMENNKRWLEELRTKKMRPDEEMKVFVQRKAVLCESLVLNGHELLEYELADSVFENLPPEFGTEVSGLAAAHGSDGADEVLSALRRAAKRIGWVDGVGPAQRAVPPRVGAVSDSRGAPRDRSTVQCYNCREFGHFQNKCPHPPRDRGPSTRGSGVPQAPRPRPVAAVARGGVDAIEDLGLQGTHKPSQILSVTNNVFDPGIRSCSKDDWSADSGATIILTNDLSALHEPNVFTEPQPIFLATNAMGGTVATGSICLESGNKMLWLHNVHCDPSASQNLLSVSAAVDLGLVFQTNEKGEPVALSGPDGHFCHIVKRSGLYNLVGVKVVHPSRATPTTVAQCEGSL